MWKWHFLSQQSIYNVFGSDLLCYLFVEHVCCQLQASVQQFKNVLIAVSSFLASGYGHITPLSCELSLLLPYRMDKLKQQAHVSSCFVISSRLTGQRSHLFNFGSWQIQAVMQWWEVFILVLLHHYMTNLSITLTACLQFIQHLFITHSGPVLHILGAECRALSLNRRLMWQYPDPIVHWMWILYCAGFVFHVLC